MNATTIDIKDLLTEDSSLALVFGENLFIGLEPDSPSTCVTLFDTFGFSDLTLDALKYEFPTIQIRVRAKTYDEVMSLALQIDEYLHGKHQETVNGTYYGLIQNNGGPALLDYDVKNRPRVIINYKLQRR